MSLWQRGRLPDRDTWLLLLTSVPFAHKAQSMTVLCEFACVYNCRCSSNPSSQCVNPSSVRDALATGAYLTNEVLREWQPGARDTLALGHMFYLPRDVTRETITMRKRALEQCGASAERRELSE
jgi:hypothetical protein